MANAKGKKRLVINLRYLNKFVVKRKFKYEGINTFVELAERGDFMISFNLRSGYHHIDIHKESQRFLGFQWEGKFYVFTVLPFGLSTACYLTPKFCAH